jgi:hypothetical protein
LLQRERPVRTSTILLLVFLLVILLIDLGFYIKEPVNGGALVTALAEESVSWAGHSYRTAAYLLSFATTIRAFIFIFVVLFFVIVFPLVFFLFPLLILFFHPPTFLVVFAARVTERSSLRVSLLSIIAWTYKGVVLFVRGV